MAAMRMSVVKRADKFTRDMGQLSAKYADIEDAVRDLEIMLEAGYGLPMMPVDPSIPDVFAVRADYPPHGSAGLGRFIATYHATTPAPSVNAPYQTFTLLRLEERR